jgi:uncharacterized protein (TIGR03435 family)
LRRSRLLVCAIWLACGALPLSFADTSYAQNEPQHTLTSIAPCSDNSNVPQSNIRLQATADDIAAGALPWYEYKSAIIIEHDPRVAIMPGTARTTAANGQTCDGYRAFNLTMHVLLENAYGVDRDYIVGAPKWTDDEKFDVTLIFSNDTIDSINKLKPAMRIRAERAAIALFLADRSNLVAHRAKNSMPAYSMVVGKKGPKFQESLYVNAATAGLSVAMDNHGGYVLSGKAARIDTLTVPLQKVLGRTVIDQTGLTGLYDFVLSFDPRAQTFTSASKMQPKDFTPAAVYTAPIMEALDKQLGLKLTSSQDSVEVIAIDRIEKPAKN